MNKNERLKKARKEANLRQHELANLLNTSQPYISSLERDDDFSYNKAVEIAKILNVDPDWLYYGNPADRNNAEHIINIENISYNSGVPYYNLDFAGGWDSENVFGNSEPSFFISNPEFERAEFACNLIGKSISCRIPNGAIIGLRELKDWQIYFPTNEIYALIMQNGVRTVKIVKISKDRTTLTLIPDPLPQDNRTEYEVEEVKVDFVKRFFQVVAWAQFKRLAM